MAIEIGDAEHPEALGLVVTTMEILDPTRVAVLGPSDVYLGDAMAREWNFVTVLRTLEIAVRGLYRHFRNELLPPDTPVEIVFIGPRRRADFLRLVSHLQVRDLIVLEDNISHIVSYDVAQDDPTASFWTITFNYRVLFVAGTGSFADELKQMVSR